MNLTIKGKLLAGYSIILLMLVLTALFMMNKFAESNSRFQNLVNISYKKTELSNDLLVGILDQGRHEKNLILSKNQAEILYFTNRLKMIVDSIEKKQADLGFIEDSEGKKLLANIQTSWNDYKPDLDQIISLTLNNEKEKASAISTDLGLKLRDKVISQIQLLIEKNKKDIRADRIQNDKDYTAALNLIIALILISIALALLVSYWIITTTTKRISFIAKEAEKISSREFTDEKLEDVTTDEMKPIFNSLISINESFREVSENANIVASGDYSIDLTPRSEKDSLGTALKKMTHSLREKTAANLKHNWLNTGQNQLNEKLRGDQTEKELAENIISFIANYVNACIGAIYLLNEKENDFQLSGQYAFASGLNPKSKFALGEGLIGQAAREQKQLTISDLRDEHTQVLSAILNAKPKQLIVAPFLFEGKTLGVIEIGKLIPFSEEEKEFINLSLESIAISINSALSRKRIKELLEETQVQSEELQVQQEELKQMNEELEEQSQNLKQQQEELQLTNEELEEQTQALEMKNKDIEAARYDIEQKTKQLEISTRYKSEFLANMSHELRTPLNSLLILSKDLSENKKKNLFADQVESANIIYKSGHDLLILINEVLDLSKIEAGKMSVNVERISLRAFCDELLRDFKHHTDQKGLLLSALIADDCPESIHSDSLRLKQIVKNLLSNAIKFTENGSVNISIQKESENTISISVTDTGIGIPEDKQKAIFEAFQQADGGTSRKYGGTGLGLSISKELARLLGGEIKLKSIINKGSTFSLVIPMEIKNENSTTDPKEKLPASPPVKRKEFFNYPTIKDDREIIKKDDKVVLIIEDDLQFADILLKQANNKGFKCLAAATGEDGLTLAETYKPHAIILDIDLPGINGHQVLAELKSNPSIRHIPVHIMSVNERSIQPIKDGAVEYIVKPVDKKQLEEAFSRIENFVNRKMRNLLIIEDDENSRKAIQKLIGNGDVKCFEAESGQDAIEIFKGNHIDCIVLDIGLKDMSGFDVIHALGNATDGRIPPIVVYTGKELTKQENAELQKYTETIIIKGVRSEERLLDETALFLHRTISNLPESKQQIINNLYDKEIVFQSKKILLVDDDMRNIFALSKILKERGMEVIKAENGKEALSILETQPEIDLILMDIMMPEMDGYEAMKRIRGQEKHAKTTIIALTAKAMKDDKQKCIDAGANDYITKPVDVNRLLSLMHVWLSK